MRDDHVIATTFKVKPDLRKDPDAQYVVWTVEELYWSRTSALKILQGHSIQQVLSPYLLIRGDITSMNDPRPGIQNAVLVEVVQMPEMSPQGRQLFFFKRV